MSIAKTTADQSSIYHFCRSREVEIRERKRLLIIHNRVRQGTAAQDGDLLPFSEIKEGDNCKLAVPSLSIGFTAYDVMKSWLHIQQTQ
ncbi:hypothetical protein NC651_008058 [Populus alba x Populus x berolinensis]|nr:hypothetical protein NC651_008058 [Populus alba x Populus x berolinensis]